MLKLTANYSEALVKLIRAGEAPINGIEVGPWFSPKMIKKFQHELPGWEFQYHASGFISRMRYQPGALEQLREYLACTQSRWISIHIELLPVGIYWLNKRFGLQLPPPNPKTAREKFMRMVSKVSASTNHEIIVENLSSIRPQKYAYAADPDTITQIVEALGVGFLLDIAHARVAAYNQGQKIKRYLERLPLAQIEQIHLSGVREKNGNLYDAHESMREKDYAILEWVMERSEPKMITLEYFREIDSLQEQLWKLRELIATYLT